MKRQQPEYIWDYDMIWVQDYDIMKGCAVFVNYRVHSTSCDLNLPFICESGMYYTTVNGYLLIKNKTAQIEKFTHELRLDIFGTISSILKLVNFRGTLLI